MTKYVNLFSNTVKYLRESTHGRKHLCGLMFFKVPKHGHVAPLTLGIVVRLNITMQRVGQSCPHPMQIESERRGRVHAFPPTHNWSRRRECPWGAQPFPKTQTLSRGRALKDSKSQKLGRTWPLLTQAHSTVSTGLTSYRGEERVSRASILCWF